MPARTPAGSRPSPSHRASAGKSRRLSPRLPVPVPPAPSQPRPGPFPVRPVPTSPLLLLLPPHTARPEEAELGADGGKERGPSSREKPPANRRTRGYVAPNGRAERVGEGAERPRGSPLPSLGRGACWELAASLPPPPPPLFGHSGVVRRFRPRHWIAPFTLRPRPPAPPEKGGKRPLPHALDARPPPIGSRPRRRLKAAS